MVKKTSKKYLVKHNLLELDRYVFPGCKSGIFYRPEQWPERVRKKLAIAEAIAKNHSLNLLKGEIYLEEKLTQLEIEAESADSIQRFYNDWDEGIKFLEIKECDSCAESEEETNIENYYTYKEAIKKGNLPLFKANKLVDKIVLGLENLKKIM